MRRSSTWPFLCAQPYTAIPGAIGVGEAGPIAAPPLPRARARGASARGGRRSLRDEGWLEAKFGANQSEV